MVLAADRVLPTHLIHQGENSLKDTSTLSS